MSSLTAPLARIGFSLLLFCSSALLGCAASKATVEPTGDDSAATGSQSKPCAQAVGDFSLRDLKGDEVRLSNHAGKVVLVSFWATWCEPCQIELPQLQDIWLRYRDKGFALLTVSVDTADKESEVRQLVRRYRYKFPVLLDQTGEVTDRFHPTMELPYSMLLDGHGRIVALHQGYRPGDEREIEQEIKKLLVVE